MARLVLNPNSIYKNSQANFILNKDALYTFTRAISSVNDALFGMQPTKEQLLHGFDLSDCSDYSLCVKIDNLDGEVSAIEDNVDALTSFSTKPFIVYSSTEEMSANATNPIAVYLTPVSADAVEHYEWIYILPNDISSWEQIKEIYKNKTPLSSLDGAWERIGSTSFTDEKISALTSEIEGDIDAKIEATKEELQAELSAISEDLSGKIFEEKVEREADIAELNEEISSVSATIVREVGEALEEVTTDCKNYTDEVSASLSNAFDLSSYAKKPTNAVNRDFAGLNESGELIDSGRSIDDFVSLSGQNVLDGYLYVRGSNDEGQIAATFEKSIFVQPYASPTGIRISNKEIEIFDNSEAKRTKFALSGIAVSTNGNNKEFAYPEQSGTLATEEYANSLSDNYDVSGAADAAEENAKNYADRKFLPLSGGEIIGDLIVDRRDGGFTKITVHDGTVLSTTHRCGGIEIKSNSDSSTSPSYEITSTFYHKDGIVCEDKLGNVIEYNFPTISGDTVGGLIATHEWTLEQLENIDLSDVIDNLSTDLLSASKNYTDEVSSNLSTAFDLSSYAKTSDVPTDLSDLNNSPNYITESEVESRISGFALSATVADAYAVSVVQDGLTYTVKQGLDTVGTITVVEDRFITSAEFEGTILVLHTNTGEIVSTDLSGLADQYYGDSGEETRISVGIENNRISAVLLDSYFKQSDAEEMSADILDGISNLVNPKLEEIAECVSAEVERVDEISGKISAFVSKEDIRNAVESQLSDYERWLTETPTSISVIVDWNRALHTTLKNLI